MKKIKVFILFSFVTIFACIVNTRLSQAAMKMSPYLQAVTANTIYVLQESDSMNPITVEYGTTNHYGYLTNTEKTESTTASPVTYVHKIRLAELQPNTMYHYRVIQGGNTSDDHVFWTAANPGTAFRFAWMADCRTGTGIHDQISRLIKDADPRFSIYGGDLCSNSSYQSYKNEFFRPNELSLIANVPFVNTIGNHEGWSQNTKAFTEAPPSSSGDQGYYSFDYGDMHVLVLNYMDEKHIKSQYEFARFDLQSTKRLWKVVVCHSPAYCAGGHGEDETMKAITKEIFEPNRVDMVIGGHSHFYQHNLINGIHHMVIGSAGANLYQPKTALYTLKSIKDYNYAIIDVSQVCFHLVVYNNRGQILDIINLGKSTK